MKYGRQFKNELDFVLTYGAKYHHMEITSMLSS